MNMHKSMQEVNSKKQHKLYFCDTPLVPFEFECRKTGTLDIAVSIFELPVTLTYQEILNLDFFFYI